MQRFPLLAGSSVLVVDAPDDSVVLRPPPPAEPIDDVAAAVRDALRFPLAGEPLEALVRRGGRATLVVEPPALPLPGVLRDPRQVAIEAAVDALAAAGAPVERQTLLVTAGLARRPGHRDVETLVPPDFARRFRGRVRVHDAEDERLVDIGAAGGVRLRIHPCLLEAEVVVVVTAAETVLHGGPATLLGAAGADAQRAAGAYSLLEPTASQGWRLALALERVLSRRVPLLGVSLALDNPRLTGALDGYPHDAGAAERAARLPVRHLFARLPGAIRRRVIARMPRVLTASGVYAGPPSAAHAEALLRATELRGARLEEPLEAMCVGVPDVTPYLPRERPNPLLAAYLGLGLALRLWRDAFPVVNGGTAILVHGLGRRFPHPSQQPYRAFFNAVRGGHDTEALHAAEHAAGRDARAIAAYRDGQACHPFLPFVDWRGCEPALSRLGSVLVAGSRDATAARSLGLVPTHGLRAALAMARGSGMRRVGFLPSPPYFPLRMAVER
ncbi:MAG: DUF2088 domain-containing protein [Thermoleophilia bacterium]|nr:DUF2088 domain-containing protein [Thermoleophilia bacterium]